MDLLKYYRQNMLEGFSLSELKKILTGESERDSVTYVDSEGCIQLFNGGCIDCVSKYYKLSNGKKVQGNTNNFALYCSKVRQAFGMSDWREEGNCVQCHLAAIEKKQEGTLVRT